MYTLRQMNNRRPVVYKHETLVKQNLSRNQRTRFFEEDRLVVCHAGSSLFGFVKVEALFYKYKSSDLVNYPTQIKGDIFRSWFERILQSLEEPCVIDMDDASHHLKFEDNIPKPKAPKAVLQKWLTENKIYFTRLETRPELLKK